MRLGCVEYGGQINALSSLLHSSGHSRADFVVWQSALFSWRRASAFWESLCREKVYLVCNSIWVDVQITISAQSQPKWFCCLKDPLTEVQTRSGLWFDSSAVELIHSEKRLKNPGSDSAIPESVILIKLFCKMSFLGDSVDFHNESSACVSACLQYIQEIAVL